MSATLRALALLPVAVTVSGGWQTPQGQPESLPAMRITVTLVQVDAVVSDSAGRHVPGLQAADFELLQDGQPQKITHFAYIPDAPPAALQASPAKDGVPPELDVPPPIAPGQVRRTVALIVDDLALSFEDMVRAREALHKYIDQQMQPGDIAAVIRTGGGVTMLQQFTSDKRILLEAVNLLKWRFFGQAGMLPIAPAGDTPERGPQQAPEALDYGYRLAEFGALRTLQDVIEGMKRMPGRKSIVFISDSLRVNSEVVDALDQITDLANRSAVSLYTVNPGGLRADSKLSAANTRIDVPDQNTRRFPGLGLPQDEPDSEFNRQAGLDYLASRTGGIFYQNTNDIPAVIRKAIDDQLGYYLLAYSPAEGTFARNPRSAKFHKITVRVKRPGLRVRWKSGFEGVADDALAEIAPPPKSREAQLAEALESPFAATDIKVRLTSLFLNYKEQGPVVYSMLQFDAKDLTFIQEPDGPWNGSVDVVTLAYSGLKQPLWQYQRVLPIHLSDAKYRAALKAGVVLNLATPAKAPGAFIMRAVVRDTFSRRIGSASEVIQVPDVRKGQLAITGIAIKLATPEILQKMGYSALARDGAVEEWQEGGPSLRRFHPGQSLTYGYMVLNPRLHETPRKAELTAQVRIYRNGKPFYTSQATHELQSAAGDPARYFGGGVLSLGSAMKTGEYILQVTVTDELAPPKKHQVSQWMDFEVVDSPPSTAAAPAARPGQ